MMAIMASLPFANSAEQLLSLLSRVRRRQHLEAIVAGSAALVIIEAAAELNEAEVGGNLGPTWPQGPWTLPQGRWGYRRTSSQRMGTGIRASASQKTQVAACANPR